VSPLGGGVTRSPVGGSMIRVGATHPRIRRRHGGGYRRPKKGADRRLAAGCCRKLALRRGGRLRPLEDRLQAIDRIADPPGEPEIEPPSEAAIPTTRPWTSMIRGCPRVPSRSERHVKTDLSQPVHRREAARPGTRGLGVQRDLLLGRAPHFGDSRPEISGESRTPPLVPRSRSWFQAGSNLPKCLTRCWRESSRCAPDLTA
jgi:hypothetical protein